jgi:hypothetical protein
MLTSQLMFLTDRVLSTLLQRSIRHQEITVSMSKLQSIPFKKALLPTRIRCLSYTKDAVMPILLRLLRPCLLVVCLCVDLVLSLRLSDLTV